MTIVALHALLTGRMRPSASVTLALVAGAMWLLGACSDSSSAPVFDGKHRKDYVFTPLTTPTR